MILNIKFGYRGMPTKGKYYPKGEYDLSEDSTLASIADYLVKNGHAEYAGGTISLKITDSNGKVQNDSVHLSDDPEGLMNAMSQGLEKSFDAVTDIIPKASQIGVDMGSEDADKLFTSMLSVTYTVHAKTLLAGHGIYQVVSDEYFANLGIEHVTKSDAQEYIESLD